MIQKIAFPLRFKILVTLLLVITVVMGIITFTMANMFHTDKKGYIHDLTSVMAMHIAEETRAILEGYRERLSMYDLLLREKDMPARHKVKMMERVFENFGDFVAVTTYDSLGVEETTVYDARRLDAAGVTRDDLLAFREDHPVPMDALAPGEIYLQNSSLPDFPCLTLALRGPEVNGEAGRTAVGVVKLDGLLAVAARSQAFETAIVDAEGRLLAHTDPARVLRRESADWLPEIEENSVGMTREYEVGGQEVVGGVASVDVGGAVAAVEIPKSTAFLASRELLRNLVFVSFGLLILSAMVSLLWSRLITRPIEHLSKATRAVAKGQFDVQVKVESNDEIGGLAGSFNRMAEELLNREIMLKQAQDQLVQSEKMAAFGQLGAGIAHEVKNPLAGILGCAQLSLRMVEKETPQEENLRMIEKETKRCKQIIESLLRFARQEKAEMQVIELAPVIEDSMAIVSHQMGLNKVQLKHEIQPDLPRIVGNGNQLQQVLMNLFINAQQAMQKQGGGNINVAVNSSGKDGVVVRVVDDGPGMPEEVRAKIFEPFFSTKPTGQGTGLGLSVSYGIVQDHQGVIEVQSEPGVGTTFVLTFPAYQGEGTAKAA